MSGRTQFADRIHDRLRWHCRRGMLELDLVLSAFLERHLERLDPAGIEALKELHFDIPQDLSADVEDAEIVLVTCVAGNVELGDVVTVGLTIRGG